MSKLMVIDSDRAVQEWIRSNLGPEGFEVTCFNDGLSALDMLSKLDPDLVLAAYNIEGINIFRFCDKLRQKSATRARPLLLLVNPDEPIDESRLRAAGVVDFIKKLLGPPDLMEKIRSYSVEPATVIQKMPSAPSVGTPQAASEEQMETLKMEELLGWSLPGEKKESSSPAPKPEIKPAFQEDDRTIIETRMPSSPVFAPPPPEMPEPEPLSLPESAPVGEEQATIVKAPEAPPSPTVSPSEAGLIIGTDAEQAEAIFSPGSVAPPSTQEEPLTKSPPSAETPIPAEALEATVTKMAREIIEKVAWEVVPHLAEILIKEELEKLKPGQSK